MTVSSGITDAFHVRDVIHDALAEGRLALALWIATQYATELQRVHKFFSLTIPRSIYPLSLLDPPALNPTGDVRFARRNRIAIQRAIDLAASKGGGVIYLPPGDYPVMPRSAKAS